MRILGTGLVVSAAIFGMTAGANASPAVSDELMLPLGGKVITYIPSHESGGSVPSVAPGQALGIACADVNRGSDVSVILKASPAPGESPADIDNVLATRQRLSHGAVHIRVPDLPDLSNHTVDVRVIVKDASGLHSCDAGRVKIT